MADKHYVGEVGTKIIVDVGEDITAASEVKMLVSKPSGALAEWTATIFEKNFLKHLTEASDWNEHGKYLLQAQVKLPDWEGPGVTVEFVISKAFE